MSRFLITTPDERVQIFEIAGPTVTIGRADSSDLVLDHPSVSRHHARLTVLPDSKAVLIDLGSLNGVFVNGAQVREQRIADQDRVSIGEYELRYELPREPALEVETDPESAARVARLLGPEAPPGLPRSRDRLTELESENELLKLLLSVGNALSSILDPGEIMQRVMELVFQMENVERGFVMLRDEAKGFRPAVLLYKDPGSNLQATADPGTVVLSRKLIERVSTERLPLLIRNVAQDARFQDSESLRLAGVRSAMCAPLVHNDRLFGIFYVDCLSKSLAFNQEQLSVFSVIAAEAAISLDNARSHEELSRQALERRALERFLSSAAVDRILAHPGEIRLGGENQTATILFADIRGFTGIAEKMNPQDVVQLLNEFFSEMTELVFQNGGTLDKYLGDGIMAVFGAPLPRPDDAARSVKTAIEMQLALDRLNQAWDARGLEPLRVGIGINTGPVTAGNVGSAQRMDYTVIGDAVNLAERLCSNAQGGQILSSGSTFRELDASFPSRERPPVLVKGREAPVEVHEILWQDQG